MPRIFRPLVALAGALALAGAALGAPATDSLYYGTTPLPEGRQMHGAAVIGDHLYVLGGNAASGYSPPSLMARINDDGTVGNWSATTPLLAPLLYIGNSTVTNGPIVYVCGGNVNDGQTNGLNFASNVVLMAAQLENGQLSQWLNSEPFPGPGVQAAAAVATRTHLYVIGGGNDSNEPQRVVYYAPFVDGGLLGPWERGPDMPRGLWFHMAGISGDRIYVWGGTTGANYEGVVSNTLVADINPDGSLSAWREIAPLPQAMYFSGSASIDGTLYNFSGRFRDASYTQDVLFSIPEADGTAEWTRVRATVPLQRYIAPAVDRRRGIIFLPGGRGQNDLLVREVFGYRVPRVYGEVADEFTGEVPPPPPPADPGATDFLTARQWMSYAQAERSSATSRRNMLLYFYTPHAEACRELEAEVFASSGFDSVAQRHEIAAVDAAEQRSLAVTYGVWRVPAIVIVSPQGRPLETLDSNITVQDLESVN